MSTPRRRRSAGIGLVALALGITDEVTSDRHVYPVSLDGPVYRLAQ